MHTVMGSCKRGGPASEVRGKEPSCIITTLYELIAVLQDVVGPDNDPLVVATVVHLLRSGRLTAQDGQRMAGHVAEHNEMWRQQQVEGR
jgi:hypothetical protein